MIILLENNIIITYTRTLGETAKRHIGRKGMSLSFWGKETFNMGAAAGMHKIVVVKPSRSILGTPRFC